MYFLSFHVSVRTRLCLVYRNVSSTALGPARSCRNTNIDWVLQQQECVYDSSGGWAGQDQGSGPLGPWCELTSSRVNSVCSRGGEGEERDGQSASALVSSYEDTDSVTRAPSS